jgi:hypothetical protein
LKLKFTYIIFALTAFFLGSKSYGQGENPIVHFSGIVVAEDSTNGIQGVSIFIPKAGRGTFTNEYGYFSLPTLVGDSVVISAVGYKKRHYIIPKDKAKGFSVIIDLVADTTMLPVVEVYPYPTKELFKKAFVSLQLHDKDYDNMKKNLDEELMARIFRSTPMDGSMNYRYLMQQQAISTSNRGFYPTIPFLNPFAWREFIKSVKRGDLKKKN